MTYQEKCHRHEEYRSQLGKLIKHTQQVFSSRQQEWPCVILTHHQNHDANVRTHDLKGNPIHGNPYSAFFGEIPPESDSFYDIQKPDEKHLQFCSSLDLYQELETFHQVLTNNYALPLNNINVSLSRDSREHKLSRKIESISSHGKFNIQSYDRPFFQRTPGTIQSFMTNAQDTKLPFLPTRYLESENIQMTKQVHPKHEQVRNYSPYQSIRLPDAVPQKRMIGTGLKNKCKKELELNAASTLCSLSRVQPTMRGEKYMKIKYSQNKSQSVQNHPKRLYTRNDEAELNRLHCFVRQELLEIFFYKKAQRSVAQSYTRLIEDNSEEDSNTKKDTSTSRQKHLTVPTFVASPHIDDDMSNDSLRVGFRCVYCAHIHQKLSNDSCHNVNMCMNAFYPKSLAHLYRLVCKWQRVHFKKCKHVPLSVKKMYGDLKAIDKTRGKTSYWVTSAIKLGLVDDSRSRGGIRYDGTATVRSEGDSS